MCCSSSRPFLGAGFICFNGQAVVRPSGVRRISLYARHWIGAERTILWGRRAGCRDRSIVVNANGRSSMSISEWRNKKTREWCKQDKLTNYQDYVRVPVAVIPGWWNWKPRSFSTFFQSSLPIPPRSHQPSVRRRMTGRWLDNAR